MSEILESIIRASIMSALRCDRLTVGACLAIAKAAQDGALALQLEVPQYPAGVPSLPGLGLPRHVGGLVDATNRCDVVDCWCKYAVDPLRSTAGMMVKAVGASFEECPLDESHCQDPNCRTHALDP